MESDEEAGDYASSVRNDELGPLIKDEHRRYQLPRVSFKMLQLLLRLAVGRKLHTQQRVKVTKQIVTLYMGKQGVRKAMLRAPFSRKHKIWKRQALFEPI